MRGVRVCPYQLRVYIYRKRRLLLFGFRQIINYFLLISECSLFLQHFLIATRMNIYYFKTVNNKNSYIVYDSSAKKKIINKQNLNLKIICIKYL
jgi:hypothetical protein